MFLRIVELQRRVKTFPCCIERPARSGRVADFKISCPVLVACSCQSTAVPLPGSDCHYGIITWIAYLRAIFFTDHFSVADLLHRHACHGNDAGPIHTLIHADLSGCTEICADLRQHLQNSDGCAFLSQILSGLHADHTAADHDSLSAHNCFSVQHVMRIDDERLVVAGHRDHDRLCSDGIDESMRFDLPDQFGGHRCIQADINTHFLSLPGHQQYGVFHLALSGGLSGCHELAAELSGRLTKDWIMSALLQYDRRFQAADSTACDQNSLGSLCFNNRALRLTP